MSYAVAASADTQYPAYADQITTAARVAFLGGDQWAYLAGIVAVLVGAALVFLRFPKRDEERRLLAEYHATDMASDAAAAAGSRMDGAPASS
jgi:DHA2 family multidrug resistance protein-like MFS transporter